MNRRTFITRAIAALGALAVLRKSKAAEPETLTVQEWAEKNRYKPEEIGPSIQMTPPARIESWEPVEGAIVSLPVGYVFMSLDEGKTWNPVGTTPGGATIRFKEPIWFNQK